MEDDEWYESFLVIFRNSNRGLVLRVFKRNGGGEVVGISFGVGEVEKC